MNRRSFFKLVPLGALAFPIRPGQIIAKKPVICPPPIQRGICIVFGVPPEIKPVERNGIEGKMRLRFGNMMAGKAYFKTETGIRCFVIEVRGDRWIINPRLEQDRKA